MFAFSFAASLFFLHKSFLTTWFTAFLPSPFKLLQVALPSPFLAWSPWNFLVNLYFQYYEGFFSLLVFSGNIFHQPILLHHQLSVFFHPNLNHYSNGFLCTPTLFHHWYPPLKNIIFISWSITLQNCKFPSCNRLICFLWATETVILCLISSSFLILWWHTLFHHRRRMKLPAFRCRLIPELVHDLMVYSKFKAYLRKEE